LIDLAHVAVDPSIIRIIPAETAREGCQVLPLAVSGTLTSPWTPATSSRWTTSLS
jgi:hypothetical protein